MRKRMMAAVLILCVSLAAAVCFAATEKKAETKAPAKKTATKTVKTTAKTAKKTTAKSKAKAKPAAKPATQRKPEMIADQQFYKDEGAHFETSYEQWIVAGRLKTPDGKPVFYLGMYHKTGSMFMHIRNGYNMLRMPDGRNDYRSYGQGLYRTLISNMAKDKAAKYPENKELAELGAKLETGDSEHLRTLEENDYPLYRGRLFMNFGGNHFERMATDKFDYKLELKTWAGPLDLDLKSAADPIFFDSASPMVVMAGPGKDGFLGMIQGYIFPRLTTAGTLEAEGKKMKLSGTSWYEHWMGEPDGKAMAKIVYIGMRLSNGGDLFASFFYNSDGGMTNSHMLVRKSGENKAAYSKGASIKGTQRWWSPVSYIDYEIGWKLSGVVASGEVTPEPGFEDSELMADEGVGAFWIGPCRFKGKVAGMGNVTGEGICRSVSPTERKP